MKRIRSFGVDYPDDEDTKKVKTHDQILQGSFSNPERNDSKKDGEVENAIEKTNALHQGNGNKQQTTVTNSSKQKYGI